MKKVTCLKIVLAVFLMTGSGAMAAVIDSFDGYETGGVETVTATWTVNDGPDANISVEVDPDPDTSGDKALLLQGDTSSDVGGFVPLAEDDYIYTGETKTLFFKFYLNSGSLSELDTAISLTPKTAPGTYKDACFAVSIFGGNFNVRWGGTNYPLFAPVEEVWYNIWAVVSHDGTNPEVKLYMNTTGAAATEADRLSNATAGDTFGYRNNSSDPLITMHMYSFDKPSAPAYMFDDISISAGESLKNPSIWATTPAPADNVTGAGSDYNTTQVQVTLGWVPGNDPNNPTQPYPQIRKYYLYMSEDQTISSDPNLYPEGGIEIDAGDPISLIPGYGPLTLNKDGIYNWRVDTAVQTAGGVSGPSDPNTIVGEVWSFETLKSSAVITVQPEDAMVDPDATVVYTVTVESSTPPKYKWYKYVDGVNDTELTTGGDITITSVGYTSELSIAHAEADDEGDYYCVANNNSDVPVPSDTAFLIVRRMLAHWTLDAVGGVADATDVTNNGYDGVVGQPAGVTVGYDGTIDGAWEPNSVEPNDIDIPQVISELPEYFTITAWIKTDSSAEQAILSLYDPVNDESMRLQLAGGELRYKTYGGGAISFDTSATVDDGQWHFVAVTYDLDENIQLFVDGILDAERTAIANSSVFTEMKIGSLAGGRLIVGALDDVILDNYALTSEQIADRYGRPVCVENPEYDFDGSCSVDLGDLAILASHWLDCGYYPDCSVTLPDSL